MTEENLEAIANDDTINVDHKLDKQQVHLFDDFLNNKKGDKKPKRKTKDKYKSNLETDNTKDKPKEDSGEVNFLEIVHNEEPKTERTNSGIRLGKSLKYTSDCSNGSDLSFSFTKSSPFMANQWTFLSLFSTKWI